MPITRTTRVLIAASVAMLFGLPVEAEAAVVPCAVALDTGAAVPLGWSDADYRDFRREATRVWASEGVHFCWTADGRCPSWMPLLFVRVVAETPVPPDAAPSQALGWIGFSERSGPGPLILLSERLAEELLGRAERGSRILSSLPGMVRRLLPRALGRALSHELGHFLLGRREHSASGVMRAAFRPEDLADEGAGYRMELSARDRRALRARCSTPESRTAWLIPSSRSTRPTSRR